MYRIYLIKTSYLEIIQIIFQLIHLEFFLNQIELCISSWSSQCSLGLGQQCWIPDRNEVRTTSGAYSPAALIQIIIWTMACDVQLLSIFLQAVICSSDCSMSGMFCFLLSACELFRRPAFQGQEHTDPEFGSSLYKQRKKCVHNQKEFIVIGYFSMLLFQIFLNRFQLNLFI